MPFHNLSEELVNDSYRMEIENLLLPGEKLISITEHFPPDPVPKLSATEWLTKLAGVRSASEIGAKGPVMAATVAKTNQDKAFRLYQCLFGRDALIVAHMLFELYPKLVESTLFALARLQGIRFHTKSEEEPGRIAHEVRDPKSDPLARNLMRTRGWDFPYYGAVDTTPLYISLLSMHARRDGKVNHDFLQRSFVARDGHSRTIIESLHAALRWLLARLGSNPEGLLESKRAHSGGLPVQTWMDSYDSHSHSDGSLPNPNFGISSIEAQGYAYDALVGSAGLLRQLGETEYSRKLNAEAKALREHVIKLFWMPKQRYFAMGSDRDYMGRLRLITTCKSNVGQLLRSEILNRRAYHDIVAQTVETMFFDHLLSPCGIRTLAADETRYRPNSYHSGSVWPWDNKWIADGLRKHGYTKEAQNLERRLIHVVQTLGCFPEFVHGGDDLYPHLNTRTVKILDSSTGEIHLLEQPPQQIQAWTVAAVIAIRNSQ